jgi:hypothetical protein
MEMARMTERGCNPGGMASETGAHAIPSKAMTMALTPPGRLRLINDNGTLELVRQGS